MTCTGLTAARGDAKMTENIRLTRDGAIAFLALDRPDKRNAVTQAMWEAIPGRVADATAMPGVRVLVLLSATPGMFSAGADIGEFSQFAKDAHWQATNRAAIRAAQQALTRAEMPTLAIIDGDCVGGGCGLALACDMRIASSRARFGITPAKLGLVYPLHDTKLLVDLVGPGQAKRMLFTGTLIGAEEALHIGLVEKLVGVDDLDASMRDLADVVAANSPFSTRAIKRVVRRILDGVSDDDADSAALFDAAFRGSDFVEGVAAFKAKRAPVFGD